MNRASVWRGELELERQAQSPCLGLIPSAKEAYGEIEVEIDEDYEDISTYFAPGEYPLKKLALARDSLISTKEKVYLYSDDYGGIDFNAKDVFEGYMACTSFKLPASLGKRWRLTGEISNMTDNWSTWICCSYALNRYLARCFSMPKDELAIMNLQPLSYCGFFLSNVDGGSRVHVSEIECLYTTSVFNNPRSFGLDSNLVPSRLALCASNGMILPNSGSVLYERMFRADGITVLADVLLMECPADLDAFDLEVELSTADGAAASFTFSFPDLICLYSSESQNAALYAIPLEANIQCRADVDAYLHDVYAWLGKSNNLEPFPATTCCVRAIKPRMSTACFVSSMNMSFYVWIFDGSAYITDALLSCKPPSPWSRYDPLESHKTVL